MAKKKAESEQEEAVEVEVAEAEPCTCLVTEKAGLKMPCTSCVAQGFGPFAEKR